MLFMVIERFRPGMQERVGERFRSNGRLMPDGVTYHASWLEPKSGLCFQVMEASDRDLLDAWIANWSDLVDFEVTHVVTSQEYWAAKARVGI